MFSKHKGRIQLEILIYNIYMRITFMDPISLNIKQFEIHLVLVFSMYISAYCETTC